VHNPGAVRYTELASSMARLPQGIVVREQLRWAVTLGGRVREPHAEIQEFSPGTVYEQQLRDGAPHFQHIRGWGVVVILSSYLLLV